MDGFTEIFSINGTKIFSDYEKFQSGFQINACYNFNINADNITILGTWRRNDSHPCANFYILLNNNLIFKYSNKNLCSQIIENVYF